MCAVGRMAEYRTLGRGECLQQGEPERWGSAGEAQLPGARDNAMQYTLHAQAHTARARARAGDGCSPTHRTARARFGGVINQDHANKTQGRGGGGSQPGGASKGRAFIWAGKKGGAQAVYMPARHRRRPAPCLATPPGASPHPHTRPCPTREGEMLQTRTTNGRGGAKDVRVWEIVVNRTRGALR